MDNHFDTVAKDWDKNQLHVIRTEAIAKALLSAIEITPEMTALEFGAGTGLLSFALKDHFAEITLMDSSPQMVCVMNEKLSTLNIKHLKPVFFDLGKDTYTEKTFNVIYSQMALHHVADVEKIISKFSTLLKPEGKLAIVDLYKEDGTFHDRDFTGHYGFTPEPLCETLKNLNFQHINYKECFAIEKTTEEGTTKRFPIFLLTAEK